jgi:hypothetical protein
MLIFQSVQDASSPRIGIVPPEKTGLANMRTTLALDADSGQISKGVLHDEKTST